MGTMTATQRVGARILGLVPAGLPVNRAMRRESPIAYWPMQEPVGASVAIAYDDDGLAPALNGTNTAITAGETAPDRVGLAYSYNGTTSAIAVTPASLDPVFNVNTGTLSVLFKMRAASVFADSTLRYMARFSISGGDSFVSLVKTSTANQLAVTYKAGGVSKQQTTLIVANQEAWYHLLMTWDTVADELTAYLNGIQQGAKVAGLGVWVGALGTAGFSGQGFFHDGLMAHGALYDRVLTPAQIVGITSAAGLYVPPSGWSDGFDEGFEGNN